MYRLGIDLGGTNIAVGVVDENYKIIGRGKVKTNSPRPAEDIADDMAKAARMALEDAGITIDEVSSMGIGAPGAIDPINGVITFANNLKFVDVPLAQMLKDRMGVDFYLENDANAAAYGEYLAGAGRGTKDFVAITLGTGVGGGIILGGKLFSGSNYAGGELGHMVIDQDGIPCNCGRVGCYEAYASATALIRLTKEAMQKDLYSTMWELCDNDLDNVNGRTAFDAWRMGDKVAAKVVNIFTRYVSVGIVNIINIFQPERICIGGGISKEKEALTDPINNIVSKYAYTRKTDKQQKVCAAELGNDAGIIGAAFLDKLYK